MLLQTFLARRERKQEVGHLLSELRPITIRLCLMHTGSQLYEVSHACSSLNQCVYTSLLLSEARQMFTSLTGRGSDARALEAKIIKLRRRRSARRIRTETLVCLVLKVPR